MNSPTTTLDALCIATVRGLAIDTVQKANSGHPGLPLGAAPMAHVLWTRHLRHNPRHPGWFDRDRFILSAGHGSALLYALLHVTGYDLPLEELQRFRQWGSITPGHPENHLTPGVEMATGPLGQGFSTAVGMAIAERFLRTTFAHPGVESPISHFTYVLASDGDLMEGVTQEAASLAGHQGLGRLIVLYDDNRITIDGSTDLAFTENTPAKYEALGWHVQTVDGNDIEAVDAAIVAAKAVEDRPSLICCKTVIGYGSPAKAGSAKSHGSPLGVEEVKATKRALGLPDDLEFHVPDDVYAAYRRAIEQGRDAEADWQRRMDAYAAADPESAAALRAAIVGDVSTTVIASIPTFVEPEQTRKASQKVLNAIAGPMPTLIGGSADLAESVFTEIHGSGTMQVADPTGRNIAFGIREHAMAAAVNGIALHGGCRAFGGTFLIFSDYCRPSLRLAALMHCPSIFLFSHDSIGLGEDGPTHQPVEQFMALRAIPNFNFLRPADANETAACWLLALESTASPCALALTRQAVPTVTPAQVADHPARRGAYVLREASSGSPRVILVATGSEVWVALGAQDLLEADGVPTRVVSMPSWFLFERQDPTYRAEILPKGIPTVSVEAGVTLGWERYAQAQVGIDRFGASAPGPKCFEEFGFTADHVARVVQTLL
ncbi:MAG TPA: transketolase [Fimbriimonadaceae bacterium]|nr:transketolase [Fimbriimonadaceae bacterium]